MADITVEELKMRLDKGEEMNIIDVRESWEYDEFNIGGKLIPLGELQGMVDELADDKSKELIVHCRSGSRSAAACSFLTGIGFTNARNLAGGVLAWQAAGGS
jgi:rhodanese-related sulfurtransferase